MVPATGRYKTARPVTGDLYPYLDSKYTIGVARIFDWGGPHHKSHAMTSSKFFKEETFCGAKISQNGRSEAVACWHLTRILVKERAKTNS